MFGPERAGLANDDIVRANALISVPVNPAFASLNLAQCVLLLSYEWQRQSIDISPLSMEMAGARMAQAIEIEKLADRFEARLDERGFFFPKEKANSMKQTLRNLFSRLPLTDSDVRTFHGIVRALAERGPKKP
jgi:tRNA/rRNA methyltransferase